MNGILHHCSLPTESFSNQEIISDDEDAFDDELSGIYMDASTSGASVRPGIVHRLDKGTSGLLVVAKVVNNKSKLAISTETDLSSDIPDCLCFNDRMNIRMHIYLSSSSYTRSREYMLVLLLVCPPNLLDVLRFQLAVIQIIGFVWLLYQEQPIVNRLAMLLVGDLWSFIS